MVVTVRSPTALTGSTHDRAGPSPTCTVQAPHWAMPQPNLVPVRPSTSRSTQSSGMSAGHVDVVGLAVDSQSHVSLDNDTMGTNVVSDVKGFGARSRAR